MLNRFLLLGESSVLLSVIKTKLSVERSNKGVFLPRDRLVVAAFSAFLSSIYFFKNLCLVLFRRPGSIVWRK